MLTSQKKLEDAAPCCTDIVCGGDSLHERKKVGYREALKTYHQNIALNMQDLMHSLFFS